jgi:hypothetical protein
VHNNAAGLLQFKELMLGVVLVAGHLDALVAHVVIRTIKTLVPAPIYQRSANVAPGIMFGTSRFSDRIFGDEIRGQPGSGCVGVVFVYDGIEETSPTFRGGDSAESMLFIEICTMNSGALILAQAIVAKIEIRAVLAL